MALLADWALVTRDVSFDMTSLPLVIVACMAARFGVQGCGRMCLTETISAAGAVEIGLASSVVISMDDFGDAVLKFTGMGFNEKRPPLKSQFKWTKLYNFSEMCGLKNAKSVYIVGEFGKLW